MGFDHLEALVHQRRRVDRDAAAHVPGRVGQRVGRADARQIGAAAEGPARGGQHQSRHRPGHRLGADQLVQRRVLGVDRDQARVGRLGQRRHQLAADHQRLLVGERDVDPLGQRHDRRAQPRRADDRVQDEVGARLRDELANPVLARQHSSPPLRLPPAQRRPGRRARRRGRRAAWPAPAPAPSSSRRTARRPEARPSEAAITSSAWVPIEPVEPSIRTLLMCKRFVSESA